ncbi:MAG TPA: DUF5655 domain-containing protein [Candidatus Dormibacteraeota bacterium]|nr:DUF5655 domain-containing protein [Candidatus Dormibacteraeota bacterium]
MDRPMWTCPDCGREFVTAKVWHSCMPRRELQEILAGRPAGLIAAYHRLEALIRELGPVQVEPLKTRIGLKAGSTFVSATFTKSAMRVGIVLSRAVDDPRLRVESYGGRHVNALKVTDAAELDDPDVRGWLAEAYWLGTEGAGKRVS